MLILRFGAGFELRGILLSLSGGAIRVALEDCGDVAEFRRVADGWAGENGEAVEIEWRSLPSPESFPMAPVPGNHTAALRCLV